MASPMTKTRYPGIYRRGSRVVFTYTDRQGKQRWGSARTIDQARETKARLHRQRHDGAGRDRFVDHLLAWVDDYHHVRPETQAEYRSDIDRWAKQFFSPSVRLADVDTKMLNDYVAWLVRQPSSRPRPGRPSTLSDSRIANILNPVRSALRDATEDGLIDRNPALGLRLPSRPRVELDDDDEGSDRKALDPDELAMVLALVDERYRLHLRFLVCTGLRASEFLGLEVRHLKLDGDRPRVLVRQRMRGSQLGALKSRHARRDLPLPDGLVDELRAYTRGRARDAPVWLTPSGARCLRDNVRNRVIAPAAGEAGLSEVGWHTFRHTCASLLFARGDNLLAVSRFLGHHSPSFTLDTYVHLFERDECQALDVAGGVPSIAPMKV